MSLDKLRAMSTGANVCATERQAQKVVMVKEDPCDMQPLPPTISNDINLNNLNQAGGDVVQFTVSNGSVNPATVIIGLGIYGTEGFAGLIDIDNAAADIDVVTSDGEANVKSIQAFNFKTNGHSVIGSKVQIFNASNDAQKGKRPQLVRVDLNGNIKNVKTNFVETDTETNHVTIANTVPFSFFQGMKYEVLAGQSVDIEIEVLGVGAIENFTPGIS